MLAYNGELKSLASSPPRFSPHLRSSQDPTSIRELRITENMPPRGKPIESAPGGANTNRMALKAQPDTSIFEGKLKTTNILAGSIYDADDEDSDFESRKTHRVLGKFNRNAFMLVLMHRRFFDILYQNVGTRRYFENKKFLWLLMDIRNRFGMFSGSLPENHRLMLIHVVRVVTKALNREEMVACLASGTHEPEEDYEME